MFGWFLNLLDKHGRKEVIMDRDGTTPYLERYYVVFKDISTPKRTNIPGNIFVHRFMKSDDPVLHTHPWDYLTIVLRGGYWENLPNGIRKWRGPGTIRWGRGIRHWVEVPNPGDCWTLFFRGKRKKADWGFQPDENGPVIPHEKYLEDHRV